MKEGRYLQVIAVTLTTAGMAMVRFDIREAPSYPLNNSWRSGSGGVPGVSEVEGWSAQGDE